MTADVAARLGYGFRFNVGLKRLHVAKWQKLTDGSLLIVSACGAQVVDPTTPQVPERLILQPTAVDALRVMDRHQAAHLCEACRAIFARKVT